MSENLTQLTTAEQHIPYNFTALKELGLFLFIVAFVWIAFSFYLYPLMDIPTTAPVPQRTLIALGIIAWFLKKRQQTWSSIGFKPFKPIALIIVLAVCLFAFKLFALQPLINAINTGLELPQTDISIFSHIHGNLLAYIGWIFIAIFVGGFAEEIVFRGYLITRLEEIFGGTRIALFGAVIVQAMIFGLGHYYQGMSGIISAGLLALSSGLFFLLSGRNLWPVIIVHALWDILGITLIFIKGTLSI